VRGLSEIEWDQKHLLGKTRFDKSGIDVLTVILEYAFSFHSVDYSSFCRHICGRHKTSHVVAARAAATMALGAAGKAAP